MIGRSSLFLLLTAAAVAAAGAGTGAPVRDDVRIAPVAGVGAPVEGVGGAVAAASWVGIASTGFPLPGTGVEHSGGARWDPAAADTVRPPPLLPRRFVATLPGPRFLPPVEPVAPPLARLLAADTPTAPRPPIPNGRTLPLPWGPGASEGDDEGDLAIRVRTRGDFGGDWTRFRPCDASLQETCNPGIFPQLHPDVLLGVEAAGSVADRIFVDVDYDQTREFSGANRFRIYYQGRDDEMLRRVEVGDISFALPETRFLTRGIPAGNFGVLARGVVGGVELQTVFAQQQGARQTREFRLGSVAGEIGVIQDDTVVVDDAGYVRGHFYFLVDPNLLPGSPHLDVLSLRPASAPPAVAPGPEPIQLYRMERDPLSRQQVEGYVQADAVAEGPGGEVRESGWFRYLRPGEDYYQHPSGLWVALRTPLRPDEALAVSYINVRGDTIGAYNPEAAAIRGEIPTLQLVAATRPQHQPGRPTWDREMKQVYRVSGSDDVDLAAVQLSISLGEESGGRTFKQGPDGRRIPLLRLFGLDEDTPSNQLDRRALFQPASELFEERGITGTFLIFPTLRPFMEPPPVPSERLDAEAARAVLGLDANERIYEADDPFEREAAGLYRLNLDVSIRSAGVTSTIALGAFGIRQGSERIFLGDRLLQPELDYLIDYEAGVVTLLQPEALLVRSSSETLQVSWEQAAVFRTSPASIVGGSVSVPVGDGGSVDFLGLYQTEREIVNRPRFGAEPGALGMVGMRSRLDYDLPILDTFLDRLPGTRGDVASRFRIDGEMAVSLPDPNLSGDAYLDDFDAGDERPLSLLSREWHLGSRPDYRDGAEDVLPPTLDASSAANLTWQHSWVEEGLRGDSIGVFEGLLAQDQIDRQINFAGSQGRETVMRLSFGRRQPWGELAGDRWRSVTALLSPTGLDLTQTEYLDFYVADGDSLTLVLDLGLVSEDAFFVDGEGNTSGVRSDNGRPWGLGVLDQEADPLRGEVWGPEADRRGVWPEACEAEPGRIYRLGDPRANCTRGNGRRDTEDLNQNGILDTTERYRRYVVRLDGSSPYMVRGRPQTGTRFRLYRIPLRGPLALNPGGAFTEADWRSVQFLRITATGSRPATFTLARMRLVGSQWVKRGGEGVLRGMVGDTLAFGGELEVTPVSVLTEGAAYQAPPGVLGVIDDPASAVGGRGVEHNEKSLALRYRDLGGGDRGEVYFRFGQRPRNFLNYTDLRVWALARSGAWGGSVPTDFFLKVGSDPENFYLYRNRLSPASDPERIAPEDWLPEHRIRFHEWTELRRRAEEEILRQPPRPGDPPVVVWSADSTHAVVLRDRARAPNLAAVREISMGVWNRGGGPVDGELWVNELRLGGGTRAGGSARIVNMELDGGDLFQARIGYTGQGPDFRQMHEMATFQSDGEVSVGGTLQAGRLLPEVWGMDVPVTVSHQRSSRDPFFLSGTDVRADLLPGLRAPGFNETRVSAAFSTHGELGVGWLDRILPGADLRIAVQRSSETTVTSEVEARGSEAGLGYTWNPAERTVGLLPGLLEPVARIFLPPGWVRRLRETRVRWTPRELSAGGGLRRRDLTVTRFDQILASDSAFDPGFTEVTSEAWLENRARIALEPLAQLNASVEVRTTRDVLGLDRLDRLDPRVAHVLGEERRSFLGRDLGWETARVVEGRVTWRPPLPPWARADLGLQTRYRSDRGAGLVRRLPEAPPQLLRNTGAERDLRANFTLEPARLFDTDTADGEGSGWARAARVVGPVNVSLQDGITSWYYREAVSPDAGFQLGFGGMERFSRMDQVNATTLVDRRGISAGSGLRFGDGLFTQVNFQNTEVASLDRRSERVSRTRSWPDLRAGVSTVPLPEGWDGVVTRVSFSSGWQHLSEEVTYGEAVLQRRARDEHRVPMEVVVEWAGGISTRYRGSLGWGTGRDPTGTTERGQREHGLSIETRLRPRGGLGDRIEEPLRLSLLVNWADVRECRVTAASADCVPFVDFQDRGVDVAVGTLVADLEVGGQLSLLDRRSFTGMQLGTTQFRLGVWARMIFERGPLELLEPPVEPF